MEYAQKGSLRSLIDAQKNIEGSPKYLSEERILDIFVQLCLGLQQIHAQKVIHRDIKPWNLFLFEDNIVKFGDFGVSKSIEETIQLNSTLTGSPFYMAPEVYQGNYGIKADIWSLGVTMLELWTFDVPFKGNSFEELQNKVIDQKYIAPLPSIYSQSLNSMILRLLRRKIKNRPSIGEIFEIPIVKDALERYLVSTVKLGRSLNNRETEISDPESEIIIEDFLKTNNKPFHYKEWEKYDENYFNCTVKSWDTLQKVSKQCGWPQEYILGYDKRFNKFLEEDTQTSNKLTTEGSKINLSFNVQIEIADKANFQKNPSLKFSCKLDVSS